MTLCKNLRSTYNESKFLYIRKYRIINIQYYIQYNYFKLIRDIHYFSLYPSYVSLNLVYLPSIKLVLNFIALCILYKTIKICVSTINH